MGIFQRSGYLMRHSPSPASRGGRVHMKQILFEEKNDRLWDGPSHHPEMLHLSHQLQPTSNQKILINRNMMYL